MECARFGVYSDAWREQSHTVWSGRGGVGVGGVGLCTGVEIRSCGNKVGGFAAGGRVLGLGERTGGCSAAHCGLLVENAMVGGESGFSSFSAAFRVQLRVAATSMRATADRSDRPSTPDW